MNNPPNQHPDEQRVRQVYNETMVEIAAGRVESARPGIEWLARAIPTNPVVGYMRRACAVVNLEVPAERASVPVAQGGALDPAALDIVAFHADLPHSASGIHLPADYMQLLTLSFESARIRAPRARRILLTDEHTVLPESVGVDEVRRFPIDVSFLMYERMYAQIAYLAAREPGRASILIDTDVVTNCEPSAIFAEQFDIGLTWRPDMPDAPFNGGVILVGPGNGGLEFMRRAKAFYDRLAVDPAIAPLFAKDLRSWWGDQYALAAMVGYGAFRGRATDVISVDGLRARVFPCEDYNFTIEPQRKYPGEVLRRKWFIHFKGNRKALQYEYLAAMRAGRI